MKKIILEIIPYIIAIVIVILIKTYIIMPVRVNGESMEPTLHNNDIMLLNKFNYKTKGIKRFDIVVIREGDDFIIKRVIGLPGERVEYKNNYLYINDKYVEEPFRHKRTKDYEEVKKVPENMYFVLGDNRGNSTDSRVLGFIPIQDILGHATYTIYPFNRFGLKK